MDPYKILGVAPSATEQEIKEAYTRLAKKYHPDINQDSETAERKMKEINAAYDQIKNMQKNAYNNASSYSSYGFNDNYRNNDDESNEFAAARNYINAGYYNEALNLLKSINNRSSKWYYYYAFANMGLGNRAAAKIAIDEAIEMEPDNYEYIMFRDNMEYNSNMYRSRSFYGYPARGMVNNPCITAMIINFLLMLLTGGRMMWFCF